MLTLDLEGPQKEPFGARHHAKLAGEKDRSSVPFLNPLLLRPRRPKRPASPRRRSRAAYEAEHRWEGPMFWITSAGVVLVCISTAIAAYQSYLTRQTMLAAISQQRAWLKLTVTPRGGLMIWPRGGVELPVDVSATNVGSVPATFAFRTVTLIAAPAPPFDRTSREFGPKMKNACGRIARLNFGVTVFPGETLALPFDIASASRRDVVKTMSRDHKVTFLIVACVDYQNGTDREAHRTQATYWITDKASRFNADIVFDADNTIRRKEEVGLVSYPDLNLAN